MLHKARRPIPEKQTGKKKGQKRAAQRARARNLELTNKKTARKK
jgi:hypothetical protein